MDSFPVRRPSAIPDTKSASVLGSKSKYELYNVLRIRYNKEIKWPDPAHETMPEFLKRCGYTQRDFENGSGPEHRAIFRRLLTENYQTLKMPYTRIAEVGFNAGASSLIILEEVARLPGQVRSSDSLGPDSKVIVTSFDIMWHPYSMYAKLYIDTKFPGQHQLIAGDSAQSIPTYIESFSGLGPIKAPAFDFIFIDGDHTYERVLCDLQNMSHLALATTPVLIDNVAPHRGCSEQVYRAYRDLYNRGLGLHQEHIEINGHTGLGYHDGLVVARYNFAGIKPGYKDKDSNYQVPDWKRMERRVRTTEATRLMSRARTVAELKRHYKQAKQFELEDGTDPYIDVDYSSFLAKLKAK